MCPMCREPVTLGGGITIENTFPPVSFVGSALKSSSLTQYSAQRGSICCGSYAFAISRAMRRNSPKVFPAAPTHPPFHKQSNPSLYEGQSAIVNKLQLFSADWCP